MLIIKGWATVPKKININKTIILTDIKDSYEEAVIDQKQNHAFISPSEVEVKEVEIHIK